MQQQCFSFAQRLRQAAIALGLARLLFQRVDLAFDLGGDKVTFGDKTKGHRFLSSGEITVTTFADYQTKLKAAKVILDQAERRAWGWSRS